MAASITIHSVLGKISQDHLECAICSDRFTEPKVLDCLHSFCLQCLLKLQERQEPDNAKVHCPLCRRETSLNMKGVAGLPNNFKLSALVEEFALQEKLMEGQGSEVKCQNCDDGNHAVSRCMDCDNFLCQECQRAHCRMAVMKSHKVYTMAQLQSGEITYKSKLREFVPKCEKHTDQNLSFYCNTCDKLVCTTCTILDHKIPNHDLIGIPEALDTCKQEVAELVVKAEKSLADIRTAMTEASESRKKLTSAYVDTNKKISQKGAKEITKISEEEQRLKQDANKIYIGRIKTFETAEATNVNEVTQGERKLDEVNQLMAQGSSHEILDLKDKLLCNLKELMRKYPDKVTDRSFMDFEEGQRSFGILRLHKEPTYEAMAAAPLPKPTKLCQKQKWELKISTQAFGFACDVAAFASNEIVVADIQHKQIITILPDRKPIGPKILQINSNPSCVAVDKNDKLIILDSGEVKIFNEKTKLCCQFIPGVGSKGKPTCLTVDDSNDIAVGYPNKEMICLHAYNPKACLIKTLLSPKIDKYLAIYKQRLIYTNWKEAKLISVDYNGDMIFSVDINSKMQGKWKPTGVCCDSDGSIYVALCENTFVTSPIEIQHYNPDGEYIESIIHGSGYAYGMTMLPCGDLVVAAKDSVKIYHRVNKVWTI